MDTSLRDCVRRALLEDLGGAETAEAGDLTSRAAVPAGQIARGVIVTRGAGCLAGGMAARECFVALDPAAEVEVLEDSHDLQPGEVVLTVRGDVGGLLAAERTALNFLQHLSGVATATRALVAAVKSTGAQILDTRKTIPGLRDLEKQAVRAGGGVNHRFGLFDQVLLKENHFAMVGSTSHRDVVSTCVAASERPVIAEATTVEEALEAVRGGASVVMLDNFPVGEPIRGAVRAIAAEAERIGAEVKVEASGGIDLSNVRAVAECGVDRISVGAITHSAGALDMSMRVEPVS